MYKQNDANSSTFLCKMYGVEVYILFLETVLVSMYVFILKQYSMRMSNLKRVLIIPSASLLILATVMCMPPNDNIPNYI